MVLRLDRRLRYSSDHGVSEKKLGTQGWWWVGIFKKKSQRKYEIFKISIKENLQKHGG